MDYTTLFYFGENMNNIFYCYSYRMQLFLRAMNEKYIGTGINGNTKTKYWTFKKSDRLDALIGLWTSVKNK